MSEMRAWQVCYAERVSDNKARAKPLLVNIVCRACEMWNEPRNLQSRFEGRAQVRQSYRDFQFYTVRELSELSELGELTEAMRGHSWTLRMRCPGERVRHRAMERCHCRRSSRVSFPRCGAGAHCSSK